MKQRIITLLAIIAVALSAYAYKESDFAGTWQSKDVTMSDETGMNVSVKVDMVLSNDNTAEVKSSMVMSIELDRDIFADIYLYQIGTGQYKLDGDTLRVEINPETIEFSAPQEEINVRGEVDMMTANQIKSAIAQNVLIPISTQMLQEPQDLNLTIGITEFDKKKFSGVENDGTKLTFNRKKDKKKK